MYVVTGATGNIGSGIVENLLRRGKTVRIIGRSEEKMRLWAKRGAQTQPGTLDNTKFLTKAFKGASAVFTMIPSNLQAEDIRAYMNTIGASTALAIEEAQVKWVVNLSSVGAHLTRGAGIVAGLRDMEEYLNKIDGLNIVHLRAAFFMENMYSFIGMIKSMNLVGGIINPRLKFPMVATADISAAAAERLINRDFIGKSVQYLLGSRDISLEEAVKLIADQLHLDNLNYLQFPAEDARKAMIEMGFSASAASAVAELYEGINSGVVHSNAERTELNTTPTSFEQFAEKFAEVYNK